MAYPVTSRLELIIDSATGERRLKELENRLDGVDRRGDQATQRMSGFSGELKLLRAAAAPVAGILTGMFAGRTLKSQIDYADQLQKTNLRIGASVEALSQYSHVASLSGVQFDRLTTAWQRQTRRISEAAQGTGAAKDALQALNLSAQELNNLAPEEQFERIAEAMNGVENAADRTAMAMKIWDTEGVSLLQITSQGTDAIRQMRDEADRLGLTISQETANAMAEYNDEMERLSQVSTGVARQLTAEFVPSITSGLQSTSEWVNEIGGASRIIDEMQDVLTATAVVLAGRYSGALASSTADMAKRTAASRESTKAEIASAQAAVRRTGAEKQAAMALLSTARLEEQATRGTAAHAFALDNVSRARVRAASAAGVHTSAISANAAAMARNTAAAGALRGALTLVGGPVGAAVMAGAAAYYFRDSLGFASAAARETREEVDQLTGSIEGLTRAQYENQWRELYNNMADARAEAERLQNQIEDLQDQASRESVMYQGRGGAASSQITRLQAELQEQLRVLEAAEEGVNRYKQAWEDFQKSQITGASIFRPLTQWLFDTGKAAGGTSREFDALNYTLGTGGEGWDDYINKLRGARDVLGMTAAETASYAAMQQGFTGVYMDMAAAVAGQTDALESYRQAIAAGNAEEASAHLERARRFAEAEAMVQAQLLNMETLTNLLKGVQTELSAVALTSALTVADAGGAGAAYVANAIRAINERASAIQRTTTVTTNNTAANREAAQAERELAAAERERQRVLDDSISAYSDLFKQLSPAGAATADYNATVARLTVAYEDGTKSALEYYAAIGQAAKNYNEAVRAADPNIKRVEQLSQQYDRQCQRGVQLTQAIDDINAAYRRGDIDGQQYGRMLQSVRDEMAELALEADPMAQEMARAWEEASNRIDETFSDAFAGAFDSFDSFADQLLDGFKRLLAELAYQATLKPIVVGFTSDMQSMMSGGGGGFGNTIGAARSLFSSGSSLLGGGSTAVAAGGLYSGASTGLAAGGLYGNAVTGGVASTGIMSSITAGVSAAMPWIAGGLAIDSLLGGGITKAISGLFGGGKTPFYGRVGTSDNSANIQQYKTDTALGTTGFARVQRVEKATSEGTQEWAANLFEASKALDSVIASTARSTTELADMKAAVNGFSVASGNASRLVKAQLVDRTLVALEAAGHNVSAAWGNLGAEELAARVERASGAMGLMSASSERLNLQFDIASSSALVAADRIAQLAGGVDQLAALQDSYYQAFFSDAERAANLQRELTQALSEMGYALPATREGFRALVEQQDRFTESGQQNYVQLLQLSGAFDQMQTVLADTSSSVDVFASRLAELNDQISTLEDDVRRAYRAFENQAFGQQLALLELMGDEQGALALQRERELQSMDPLLHETQRRIWAMQDEAEAQQKATQAAQQYIGELSRIRDQLNSSIGSINQWIDQRTATSGTPAMNLEAAGEQFARQLVLAENGDRDALQNITQYADRYLAAGEGMFASGSGFQRIQEDVLASLEGLPEALSDAEFIVDGFRDIVSNEMAREIERAIFSSQYKIDTLIEFAADASRLPKDLRTILGEQAHRLDSTLNYLLGENQLDNELRRLALESTNNLVSTVDYITGFELSESDKLLALSSSNTMSAVIDYIVGSDIDRGSRILALESSNRYTSMIDMILGRNLRPDDRRLALDSSNRYASLIDYVVRSELTGGNRRLALSSLNEYDALIDYATRKNVSSDDRRLALDNGNRYLSTMDYIVGRDIDDGSKEMALGSSNRYLSTVNLVLGSNISAANRTLALESANRFDAVINYVVDSPLTGGDRRLALASGQSYEALIGYYVDRDVSQADRELALASGNRYLANIEYYVGRDISSADRRLALSSNNRYVSVIDQIIGKQITGGDRRLALNSTNSYLTTVDAVLENGIAADVRTFGLANSNSIMTTIDGVLASQLPSDVRTLALEDSNRFVTTLEAALADGRLTGDERKLLDARSETVVKTLETNGLDLSKEEWAVINAASGTRRLELLADVAFGRTDLDELGKIEGNTKSLEERAYDQLASLNGLVGEMARTTDQFVGLNSNVVSLRDAINALGVAQNEAARIEREQAVRGVEDEARVVTDRLSSTWDARSGALSEIKSIENWGKGKDIDRLRPIAEQDTGEGVSGWHYSNGKYRNWKGWEPYFNELTGQLRGSGLEDMTDNQFSSWLSSEKKKHDPGTWSAEYIEVLARRIRAQELVAKAERDNAYKVSLYNQLPSYTESIDVYQQQLADLRKEYAELAGSAAPFAKGGVFTNSIVSTPTYFDMGLMGEEDPEAIMPLSRAPGGRLGVDASGLMRIPDGQLELPMPNVPLPQFPQLGSNDVLQVLQDVKRELQESRKENKRLQEENNRHAAAAVAVQQAGFNGQINELQKSNAALGTIASEARLKGSRR